MTVIYRIQDRYGRGPWKPGFSRQWVEDREDLDNLAPMKVDINKVHLRNACGYAMGFGCKTTAELRRWITPGEYEKLKEFGYRAVRMKVDGILQEDDTQVLFERAFPLSHKVTVFKLY